MSNSLARSDISISSLHSPIRAPGQPFRRSLDSFHSPFCDVRPCPFSRRSHDRARHRAPRAIDPTWMMLTVPRKRQQTSAQDLRSRVIRAPPGSRCPRRPGRFKAARSRPPTADGCPPARRSPRRPAGRSAPPPGPCPRRTKRTIRRSQVKVQFIIPNSAIGRLVERHDAQAGLDRLDHRARSVPPGVPVRGCARAAQG